MSDYKVIVYGNGLQAVFAACKAASQITSGKVLLVVPDTTGKLGGIVTVGGQNYWDQEGTARADFQQKGSFYYTFSDYLFDKNGKKVSDYAGKGYSTDTLAQKFATMVGKRTNIEVMYRTDICDFATTGSPYRITSVTLKGIERNSSGYIVWKNETGVVKTGDIFVDASEEGRLARMANTSVTVGRYDWPWSENGKQLLDGADSTGRQQAATLMFKIKGVVPPAAPPSGTDRIVDANGAEWDYFYRSQNASGSTYRSDGKCCESAGGRVGLVNPNGPIKTFNDSHGGRYAFKGYNMARDGYDSDEWWINTLMIFHVDGRANERDVGTKFYPNNVVGGCWNVDKSWAEANNLLNNTTERKTITECIQSLGPQFTNAELVIRNGKVVTGEVLYLRETVHMSDVSTNRAHGTEDTNYHITMTASKDASTSEAAQTGADLAYKPTAVGVIYYGTDMHPYKIEEMKVNGNYVWGTEYTRDSSKSPPKPVYVPYNALTTRYVANLLLPGYAANMCSYAWAKARVAPNLAVLGDAAGVAAGYCAEYNASSSTKKWPYNLSSADITTLRTRLKGQDVRLDKKSYSNS